jgi:hypothetical protein
MRILFVFLAVCLWVTGSFCGNSGTSEVVEDVVSGSANEVPDWIELADPESWQPERGEWSVVGRVSLDPKNHTRFAVEGGQGIWVNGTDGKTVDLHSTLDHGDVELHLEFMVPKGSNSGVYFQSRYEIQIFDSWGVDEPKFSDCGGIYQRWENDQGFEGHPPQQNASRPPGEWQTFDVIFRAPRFDSDGNKSENARFVKVLHNGAVVHENVELSGPTRASSFEDESDLGPLMIQGDHGPVAFRNAKLRKLESD